MFLWNLLNKSNEELVKRVFQIQRDLPTAKSWVSSVQSELKMYNINYTFDEIAGFTKSQFKQLVSRKMKQASEKYLSNLKQSHSKTQNLVLGTKIQNYLTSNTLSFKEKQTLYKLRCRMENVKNNYRSMYKDDLKCIFCESPNSIDSFNHYLETCQFFKQSTIFQSKIIQVKYVDLFGDLDAQVRIVRLWLQIEEKRKEMLL